MADAANTGNPDLATHILGVYIVDPIVCPATNTFTYSINAGGKAACANGHSYQ